MDQTINFSGIGHGDDCDLKACGFKSYLLVINSPHLGLFKSKGTYMVSVFKYIDKPFCLLTEFEFCFLMTPGLRKDIQCHVWTYSFSLLANHQIRHQPICKVLAVSLVIADGPLTFLGSLCGYVRANILTLSPLRVAS